MTTITPSLEELAAKCEQATAEQQAQLLREAFYALFPAYLVEPRRDRSRKSRFIKMIDANAFESAAMMLAPEGWQWRLEARNAKLQAGDLVIAADGATPALALCAAALRAHAKLSALIGNEGVSDDRP
jgi:hypothetical protein